MGYTFDHCYECFVGSGPRYGYCKIRHDLGVMDGRESLRIESFGRCVGAGGQVLDLYADHRRLRERLLALAPEASGMIRRLCRAMGRLREFVMSEPSLTRDGLPRFLRSLPALPTLVRWSGVFVRSWCSVLKSPLLREAIPAPIGWTDFPLVGPHMPLPG